MTPDRFIAWMQVLIVCFIAIGVCLAMLALWRILAGRLIDLAQYEADIPVIAPVDGGQWDDDMPELADEGQET